MRFVLKDKTCVHGLNQGKQTSQTRFIPELWLRILLRQMFPSLLLKGSVGTRQPQHLGEHPYLFHLGLHPAIVHGGGQMSGTPRPLLGLECCSHDFAHLRESQASVKAQG